MAMTLKSTYAGRRRTRTTRRAKGLGTSLGALADQLFGLGRRKRRVKRVRRAMGGLGASIGTVVDHLFGLGRRKRKVRRTKRGGFNLASLAPLLLGLGRRKKRGRGIFDFLKKVHDKIKSGKYISRGADAAAKAGPVISQIAKTLGYGRKRVVTRRRRIGGARIGQVIMR